MSEENKSKNESIIKIDSSTVGNVTGIDNSTNYVLDSTSLFTVQAVTQFSTDAARHISKVAEVLAKDLDFELPDLGLDSKKIKEKFDNMKCSETYVNEFEQRAAYFPSIQEIIANDSVKGGADTIKAIQNQIIKLYLQILNQFNTGSEIHNIIYSKLSEKLDTDDHKRAADIFICYTVYSCGIFNEKK